MVKILRQSDAVIKAIAKALERFEQDHGGHDSCILYRYNPASIRIRIVHQVFRKQSKGERHDYAMHYLKDLPEDILSEISILLCLEPGENSLLSMEFGDPSLSKL